MSAKEQRYLHRRILAGAASIYHERTENQPDFKAGKTYIPPSGKVIGPKEIQNGVESIMDGWFTHGRWTKEFEKRLRSYMGIRHAIFCNSGSSANLLALTALMSPKMGTDRLRPGDEVVVAAACFPTTLNPVIMNGLVPVFVDINAETLVPDNSAVDEALSRERARAIFMAHTLGNPVPIVGWAKRLKNAGIYLIEDNCDALGSKFRSKMTGGFGVAATQSFYPAHHITTGEGGAVVTRSPKLKKIIESYRDWGRDCWCEPGEENTCGKRFDWEWESLPDGYDHKYVYSHIGYNLKSTDMAAAIGVAQMDSIEDFVKTRKRNFGVLYDALEDFEDVIILPKATSGSSPSWFGFPVTIRKSAPFGRAEVIEQLSRKKIGTRNLFAGNILRQPAYKDIEHVRVGDMANSDLVAESTFWVGVWPGITSEMIEYMAVSLQECLT